MALQPNGICLFEGLRYETEPSKKSVDFVRRNGSIPESLILLFSPKNK